MALKKVPLDIDITDGLSQKVAAQKLPMGKSAAAINLVKNKLGQLEKRLGFNTLNTSFVGQTFIAPDTGIALGDWQGNLFAIQRGYQTNGVTGSQRLTALSSYSADKGNWVYRGPVSECNVTADGVVGSANGLVFSPTDVIVGDYRIQFWIEATPGQSYGTVHWQVMEASSGNVVIPSAQFDFTNITATKVEVINTGTDLIVVYNVASTDNLIVNYASTANITPSMWHFSAAAGGGTLVSTNVALDNNFEIAPIGGDTGHWLLAWGKQHTANTDVVVTKYDTSANAGSTTTFVNNTASKVASFGLRSDTTDHTAFAYVLLATGSIEIPASQYTLNLALLNESTMVQIGSNLSGVYTGGTGTVDGVPQFEFPPLYVSIGKTLVSNVAHWTAAWSPYNSRPCFNTPAASSKPVFLPFNNSRVSAVMFHSSTGPVLDSNSTAGPSSATILQTYNCHLMSKFLEANNILYCLVYLPSPTQGGYLVMAADFSQNPTDNGSGLAYPMRPVAQIQTRTCLTSVLPAFNLGTVFNPGPCNFTLGTDQYSTAYCSYTSTAQGNKALLAAGSIQMAPMSGYPKAAWGTMTCIGGALPSVFDGASVFEQNFLQCPESSNMSKQSSIPGGMGAIFSGFTAVPQQNGGGSFNFASSSDAWSWIVTYEQFDDQGNFHQSARSVPVTVTGAMVAAMTGVALPNTFNISLTMPTLGPTLRTATANTTSSPTSATSPDSPVNIGVYRTAKNGSQYFRVYDNLFDGNGQITSGSAAGSKSYSANISVSGSSFVTTVDNLADGTPGVSTGTFLQDGAHPLLYGDGTNGAPGALDDFCPPAAPILVRHKERLWVSRGNQVLYTKQRGLGVGPGYNEQVNVIYVGNDDSLTGAEGLDDKFIAFKQKQLYYISGDGPADDGSGNSFSPPQPIPTDSGCNDPRGVKTTPDGVYFMSEAGLRVLTRALAVEYAGGPVEDELAAYPTLISTVLYPTNNKIVFIITNDDSLFPHTQGEWINRDYVLDAWTTATLCSDTAGLPLGSSPIAGAAAFGSRLLAPSANNTGLEYVFYLMTKDGLVWQENDPNGAAAYFDAANYVWSFWSSPFVKGPGEVGRYRLYDILTMINSADPHHLKITAQADYGGGNTVSFDWTWAQISASKLNLTQLRNYWGQLMEGAAIVVLDSKDPSSITGKGAILLGLTLNLGIPGGTWKPGTGATK